MKMHIIFDVFIQKNLSFFDSFCYNDVLPRIGQNMKKTFSNFNEVIETKEQKMASVISQIAENMTLISSTFQANEEQARQLNQNYDFQSDYVLNRLVRDTEVLARDNNITLKIDLTQFRVLVDEDDWNGSSC